MPKGPSGTEASFAYKLQYVWDRAHELLDFTDYQDLFAKYETLQKISFDYAVVEKEPNIQVMRFAGQWKDMGTWNTLTEAMEDASIGKAILNDSCQNVHVLNELDVPVLCMGLKDVGGFGQPGRNFWFPIRNSPAISSPMWMPSISRSCLPRSPGAVFRVLDVEDESMTIKVTLNPGHQMNYHSHSRRDEVWTVIAGKGRTIVGRYGAACAGW